jgi:hypothetical protein
MNEVSDTSKGDEPPWIAMGEDEANEDMLIGNRSGLMALCEAIELAIEKGEHFTVQNIGVSVVRLLPQKPAEWQNNHSWRDNAFGFGCMLLVLVCGGVFFYGLVKLIDIF